jgi:DeoR family transcriptional regulator, fructose operon transcriptional repressor
MEGAMQIAAQASPQSRRAQLLELLRQDTVMSIRSLSEHLAVSSLTIRRDLDTLQSEGAVERLHGGVRLLPAAAHDLDKREVNYFFRRKVALAEKRAIAGVALQYLLRDQVVFLDASTTALCLAQAIPEELALTIVTHSAILPVELALRPNIQVISTGGVLHSRSLCYLGSEAECRVRQLHAERAFFGLKGLSLAEGCTDANVLEIELKSIMANRSQQLYILADHTKLGKVALSAFAALEQVHTLITDERADPELVSALRRRGIEVQLARLPDSGLTAPHS